MKPEDDPEARIRQLEQPLADVARASEMGATQPPAGYPYQSAGYTYPQGAPAPPPLTYGRQTGLYFGTPPKSPATNRVWWIVAIVFIIGVVPIVGGIVVYNAFRTSQGGVVILSPTPSFSPSTSSRRATPSSPGTTATGTPTPSGGPSTSPSSAPTPPAGGSLSVSGFNENRTIVCNDSIVDVSGVSNTVVITGHCTSLTVSGVQNSVTVDAADTIDASGFNNNVTYHSGSPKISNAGASNVVQQG